MEDVTKVKCEVRGSTRPNCSIITENGTKNVEGVKEVSIDGATGESNLFARSSPRAGRDTSKVDMRWFDLDHTCRVKSGDVIDCRPK